MKLGIGLVAASVFGALAASPASAMPVAPAPQVAPAVEQVRTVCDPYTGRCWWRPNYYGYYGPRPYYRPRYYGYYGPRPYYGPHYRYW